MWSRYQESHKAEFLRSIKLANVQPVRMKGCEMYQTNSHNTAVSLQSQKAATAY